MNSSWRKVRSGKTTTRTFVMYFIVNITKTEQKEKHVSFFIFPYILRGGWLCPSEVLIITCIFCPKDTALESHLYLYSDYTIALMCPICHQFYGYDRLCNVLWRFWSYFVSLAQSLVYRILFLEKIGISCPHVETDFGFHDVLDHSFRPFI